MVQRIAIALAAGALVAVGGLTAAAQDLQATIVSTVVRATASPSPDEHAAIAKATIKVSQTNEANVENGDDEKDADDEDSAESDSSSNANNAHGVAVSTVAKSDCREKHTTGSEAENHGGCVLVAAKADH
jgi:hypothetical protein